MVPPEHSLKETLKCFTPPTKRERKGEERRESEGDSKGDSKGELLGFKDHSTPL